MEVSYRVSKSIASTKFRQSKNTPKRFWNHVVRDAERKLDRAERKAKQLQEALKVFRKNAAERAPIPGELSSKKAGTDAKSIPA